MKAQQIPFRKCQCGDPICDQYTMVSQGSVGFNLADARLFSQAPVMKALLQEAMTHLSPQLDETEEAFAAKVHECFRRIENTTPEDFWS